MTHHPLPPALALLGLSSLACLSGPDDAPPPTEPSPPPGPVVEQQVAPPAPTPQAPSGPMVDGPQMAWPLIAMQRIPDGRTIAPPGDVVDLELSQSGDAVLALTADAKVFRWDFQSDWQPVAIPSELAPVDLAVSPFDGSVYAAGRTASGWAIERWDASGVVETEYQGAGTLGHLVVPLLSWNGTERVFFSAETTPGHPQILSVQRGGRGVYELSSVSGALGEQTEAAYRDRRPEETGDLPPAVMQADSATPMSVDPGTGRLIWRDGDGRLHVRTWADWNWGVDHVLDVQARDLRVNPNGSVHLAWDGELRLLDARFAPAGSVDTRFLAPPAMAPNGRTLVGLTDQGVSTVAVDHPFAAVRYLDRVVLDPDEQQRLFRDGIAVRPSQADQLYTPYEWMAYDVEDPPPIFASIDGLLEVLHAGFEAVFMTVERDLSAPALQSFATELERASRAQGMDDVAQVAVLVGQIGRGDYDHPDGKLVLAEQRAMSPAFGREVDFGDFKPRGPYAGTEATQNYFRAFKTMNALRLTPDQAQALAQDDDLMAAWRAWTGAQAAFLQGSRQQAALDAAFAPPAWVRAECRIGPPARRVYPLNWPPDSEILDRTVLHKAQPEDCMVPGRYLPHGLDLFVGLGSPFARDLLRPEYARTPELEAAHDRLIARFGGPMQLDGVVPGWLRTLQLLSTDAYRPEGVSAAAWHARLLETALASWTSLRHTMVLLNEVGMAEMGGGEEDIFERMGVEPARGVVDPVPESWEQLARVVDLLAEQAARGQQTERLVEVLRAVSQDARDFGSMARRQVADTPLTEEEYTRVRDYARSIEHPYVLFKAAALDPAGDLRGADPMPRVVDISGAKTPDGDALLLHVAVGRPRIATVLLGDRGVLVPGRGALYSYYEVVTQGDRLSDEDWRQQVDSTEPPEWSIAHDSWSPSL